MLGDDTRRRLYDLQRTQAQGSPFNAQNPFEGIFSQPPQPVIIRPARRVFRCSLAELEAGGSRTFKLRDTPYARMRDAFADGVHGAGAQAAVQVATAAVAIAWRFPGGCPRRRLAFHCHRVASPRCHAAYLAHPPVSDSSAWSVSQASFSAGRGGCAFPG